MNTKCGIVNVWFDLIWCTLDASMCKGSKDIPPTPPSPRYFFFGRG